MGDVATLSWAFYFVADLGHPRKQISRLKTWARTPIKAGPGNGTRGLQRGQNHPSRSHRAFRRATSPLLSTLVKDAPQPPKVCRSRGPAWRRQSVSHQARRNGDCPRPAEPGSAASGCKLPCCGPVAICSIQWPQGATAVLRTRRYWVLPTATSSTALEALCLLYQHPAKNKRTHRTS